jgi:hypothetical protein
MSVAIRDFFFKVSTPALSPPVLTFNKYRVLTLLKTAGVEVNHLPTHCDEIKMARVTTSTVCVYRSA